MILLLSAGRSGTSMIANIFADHGVWIGDCDGPDVFNRRGYFTNKTITQIIRNTYGTDYGPELPAEKPGFIADVCDALEVQGYQGGKILVKTHSYYQNIFNSELPLKIAVRRPVHRILDSFENVGRIKPGECEKQEAVRLMDRHLDAIPYQLESEELLLGDYRQLERIMGYCNIEFKKEIADEVVKRGFWC